MPGTRARSTVMIKVSYHNETQYVKQKKKKKLGNRYRFGFVEDVGGQSAEADGEIGRQLAQLEVRPDGQGRHFLLRNRVTERVDSSTHSTKKKTKSNNSSSSNTHTTDFDRRLANRRRGRRAPKATAADDLEGKTKNDHRNDVKVIRADGGFLSFQN